MNESIGVYKSAMADWLVKTHKDEEEAFSESVSMLRKAFDGQHLGFSMLVLKLLGELGEVPAGNVLETKSMLYLAVCRAAREWEMTDAVFRDFLGAAGTVVIES